MDEKAPRRPVREEWTSRRASGKGGPLGVPWSTDPRVPSGHEGDDHDVVSGGGLVEHEKLRSSEGSTHVD
ncbi:hypothetical protein [Nocardioides jejuensis]|uniref:Uncharacterized protein n=1 Tax=Nocardioides jejuensis TaxID=2502782 RepID=A0A4R1CB63_9ACTN|nr:hypothetical protein [Nocardioides jejuensis]TCJ28313.1 hypothetical protein EPD65_08225 [Nocardioides jejuensis]